MRSVGKQQPVEVITLVNDESAAVWHVGEL